eukprot:13821723-Heterocapsa_arctica.AAC.1
MGQQVEMIGDIEAEVSSGAAGAITTHSVKRELCDNMHLSGVDRGVFTKSQPAMDPATTMTSRRWL